MKRMLLNAKFLLEAGPIIVFFATYKLSQSNLVTATSWIMGATLVCLLLRYVLTKRISLSLMFSGAILLVAGSITLITGNTTYIKMKPTIVFGGYALAIYLGVLFKKFFIMDLVEDKHLLRLRHWKVLSLRVSAYFLFLATLNEITWRCFSEEIWVNFKIFGIFPLSFIFFWWQLSFIAKHKSED
jgi:intracellular septation protein